MYGMAACPDEALRAQAAQACSSQLALHGSGSLWARGGWPPRYWGGPAWPWRCNQLGARYYGVAGRSWRPGGSLPAVAARAAPPCPTAAAAHTSLWPACEAAAHCPGGRPTRCRGRAMLIQCPCMRGGASTMMLPGWGGLTSRGCSTFEQKIGAS